MSGPAATRGSELRGNAVVFAAGSLFGVGLLLSGMTRPAVVQGFLDVTGAWNPTLALVMGAAVAVHFVLYRLIRRRRSPVFDDLFHIPSRRDIDSRLVLGAAIFGVGWGMAGFCPGPGLLAAVGGLPGAALFAAAMTCGMLLQHATAR